MITVFLSGHLSGQVVMPGIQRTGNKQGMLQAELSQVSQAGTAPGIHTTATGTIKGSLRLFMQELNLTLQHRRAGQTPDVPKQPTHRWSCTAAG